MTQAGVAFNPFQPGFFEDPYAQYSALRAASPVHETLLGPWLLTRYDDCVRLLRDPTLSVDPVNATPTARGGVFEGVLGEDGRPSPGSRAILNLDPPDHDRLRRIFQKAFTPKLVEGLRPLARGLVQEAFDAAEERGEMDVIADLAFPLPFTVISEMLRVPTEHRDQLREWSHAMVKTLDPIITEDEIRAAMTAGDAMTAHVSELIEQKRRAPDDGLISALVAAGDGGDVLDDLELLEQVVLLYVAGHETTVNLIGNGTLALLRNPDQAARLREDPALDQNAVEELLRYDSPVQFSRRITVEPIEIGGRRIEAGMVVFTGLGAANHDPEKWGGTADELDLARAGAAAHLSFGSGIHHCLGASLARLEGSEVFGPLVRRFPSMAPVEERAAWNGRMVLRGLDRLPVTL
ncbi:MAG: cytochrome P450 [Actinobacteria bacterium]|nr:cytochrome P450 [Actinomycetota bacterium]